MKRLTYSCFIVLSVAVVACGSDTKKKPSSATTTTGGTGGTAGEPSTAGSGGNGGSGGDPSTTGATGGTGGTPSTGGTGGSGGTGGIGAGGAPGGAGGEGGEGGEGGAATDADTGSGGTGGSTAPTLCEAQCINQVNVNCPGFDMDDCVSFCETENQIDADYGCTEERIALLECTADEDPGYFECNTDTGFVGLGSACYPEQLDEFYCLFY